jgi:4-hydroxy-tetrahydrodipicolinate synthase
VYSGDDSTALEWMLHGAKGVISVTANVAPQMMRILAEAALNHRHTDAVHLNQKLSLLHERLCLEPNPIPVKWGLSELGKIEPYLRLPLLPLDTLYHHAVKEAMQLAELELVVEDK